MAVGLLHPAEMPVDRCCCPAMSRFQNGHAHQHKGCPQLSCKAPGPGQMKGRWLLPRARGSRDGKKSISGEAPKVCAINLGFDPIKAKCSPIKRTA